MTLPGRFMWINSKSPPPPSFCQRIATNQIGEPGVLSEPLEDTPNSGTWTGLDSGAVGTHQRYEYEEVTGQGENIFQQYIVMHDVSGNFDNGEALTATPI